MCHRVRVTSSCGGHGEVSPLLTCKPLHLRNRPDVSGSSLVKSINQATPRLQRILIRTFPYYFTVCYIPELTNQLADCLSNFGRSEKDNIKLPKLYLYQITNQLSTRSDTLNQLRLATQEDDEPVLLKHTITQGWPSTIKGAPMYHNPIGHSERNLL